MKKCQNCNLIFDDTKKFYNKCGKPLISADETFYQKSQQINSALESQRPPYKSLKLKIGITIASLIMILVAGIIFFKFPSGTIKDIDGNVYHTIKIGKQVWTAENLRTTKYNNGSDIPLLNNSWGNSIPGYCYLTNNPDSIIKYGILYNWFTIDTKALAPNGWHVPSNAEWNHIAGLFNCNGLQLGWNNYWQQDC